MEFGSTFRTLRKNKQISLKNTASGIVSESFLAKFEKGESDISISHFSLLLSRLNISLDDFYDFDGSNNNFGELLHRVKTAYQTNTISDLKLLRDDELAKLTGTSLRFHLYNALMLSGLISELESTPPCEDDAKIIYDYLFNIEFWGVYEIELFGNTTYLLSGAQTAQILRVILKKADRYKSFEKIEDLLLSTLLNILVVALDRKDMKLAKIVIEKLENTDMSETRMFFRSIYTFYVGIYQCEVGDIVTGMNMCTGVIQAMKLVGSNSVASRYQEYLNTKNYS